MPTSPRRFQLADVLPAASAFGWEQVLCDLTKVTPEHLERAGRGGGPCPWCGDGGKADSDRFNIFDDFGETGEVFCRRCFDSKAEGNHGHGVSAVEKDRGIRFGEVLRLVAEHVGLAPPPPPVATTPAASTPASGTIDPAAPAVPSGKFDGLFRVHGAADPDGVNPPVLATWCKAKPPIAAADARAAGAVTGCRTGKGSRGTGIACVAFPLRDEPGGEAVGWLTMPASGEKFPATKRSPNPEKNLALKGGRDGLTFVCTPEEYAAAKVVVLCEGVGDALALAPHLPEKWVAISNGSGAASKSYSVAALAGKRVIVAGDNDEAGRKGVAIRTRRAAGVASSVAVTYPAGEKDVRDLLKAAGDDAAAAAAALLGAAEPYGGPADDPAGGGEMGDRRVRVLVTPDLHLTVARTIDALAADPGVYRWGDALAELHPADDDLPCRVAHLKVEGVAVAASRAARFFREKTDSEGNVECVHVEPPGRAVAAVAAAGRWPGVRPLELIASGPVLRPDGTVLASPGYDAAARLFVPPEALAGVPPIPADPSREDAAEAADLLMDLVGDFPFAGPAHRSAWLSGLLAVVGRPAFAGPTPLVMVVGNKAGVGKGRLVTVLMLIAAGRSPDPIGLGATDEETDKRILSVLLNGPAAVLIDNVRTGATLARPALERLLTADTYTARDLGRSRTLTVPNRAVWFATGNNLAAGGDMPRRILPVRLATTLDRPQDRPPDSFRHPDIEGHAEKCRGRYLAAALTILRAYFAAGKPEPPGGRRTLGSFEGWSGAVRDAIIWAGLADPLDARDDLDVDDGGDDLARLIEAMETVDPGGEGMTAGQMIDSCEGYGGNELRDALNDLCDAPGGQAPTRRKLGNVLREMKGRPFDGRCVAKVGERRRYAIWAVRPVVPPTPESPPV